MSTTLPGFRDRIHDAQQSFRHILAAFTRPGLVQALDVALCSPTGMMSATAAACLTLLDLEVTVWLQPGWEVEVRQWLLFHTGCRFAVQPEDSDFAIVFDANTCPALDSFHLGHSEYPEASTTVFLQVPNLNKGAPVHLQGPGIQGQRLISPQVPASFWPQWQQNTDRYPLGVDVILISDRAVMGLPRTAHMQASSFP